jgi:RHS repeat-associated protein
MAAHNHPPESGINSGCPTNDNSVFPRYYYLVYCVQPNNPDGSSHCATEHFYFPTPDSSESQCVLTGISPNYTLVCSTPSDVVNADKNLGRISCAQAVGNPCNAATGNKYQPEEHFRAGDGVPAIVLHYNSQLIKNPNTRVDQDFGFGMGWSGALTRHFEAITPDSLFVRREDGRRLRFVRAGSVWQGPADVNLVLTQDAGGYTITLPDGATERYDTVGRQVSNTNRDGHTTTYGATLTGPFGHTFTVTAANGHVTSLTDGAGQAISFSYDGNNNLTRVDYPDNTARIYHYENTQFPNYLTGISYVDAQSVTTRYATYAYDANGKAVKTEHAQTDNGSPQEKFMLAYDSDTQTTVTDSVGMREVMTFSTNLGVKNLVNKINQSDGKSVQQIFDANNNLTCKKDEENRVSTYAYNTTNQRTGMTEGLTGDCANPVPMVDVTRTTNYAYLSPVLDLPAVITSASVYAGQNKTTNLQYTDTAHPNLPTAITQSGFTPAGAAVSRTVTLGYNAFGQVNLINGPRTDVNDVTMMEYYECTTGGACGQLKKITNAMGHITTYDQYDANGRLKQMSDPNGLVTTYSYDARGRVKTITRTPASGAARTTEYRYTAFGEVSRVIFPDGITLDYAYDAAQDLRTVTDNLGNRIEYKYDLKGNRIQEHTFDPDGALVRQLVIAHDLRNRVASVNSGGSLTQQFRDAIGNLVSQVDPNNNPATAHDYDAFNRLIRTVDALGGNTGYAYDPNDRLKQVATPNGAATTYQYDDLGNLLAEQSPDRGTLMHAYDNAGNLVATVDARGVTVRYAYDALNRLTFIDYPGSDEDVSYTYDAGPACSLGAGRLCTAQDESGLTEYAYDAFGNVTQQAHTELGVTYTTGYTHDAGDRVTAITYPDGRRVTYTRDALGRITAVTATVNGVATVIASGRTYRADGLLTAQTYGNGLPEVRQYDLQGQLTYQSLGQADTRVYAYDPNGNLTQKQTLPEVADYGYDPLDRLRQTTRDGGSDGYTYDGNGNRLSDTQGMYIYLPDSNRLSTAPTGTITLDPAGNTLTDGTGREYRYNQTGRLVEVSVNGAKVATYTYNHLGQRTRKVTADSTRFYHYDTDGLLLAETDETQTLRRAYVYADAMPLAQYALDPVTDPRPLPGTHANPNSPGQGQTKGKGAEAVAAHRPAMPEPANRPGATDLSTAGEEILVYLHTDHQNTPRLATSTSAIKVWSWEEEAFGKTLPDEDADGDGKKTVMSLRYAGQYFDSETGLHYNWHRYYDPKIGRYITSDPIGLAGGLNTYTYAYNNPLRYIDPTGLLGFCSGVFGPGCPQPPGSGLCVKCDEEKLGYCLKTVPDPSGACSRCAAEGRIPTSTSCRVCEGQSMAAGMCYLTSCSISTDCNEPSCKK